jgi:hypothetical protein
MTTLPRVWGVKDDYVTRVWGVQDMISLDGVSDGRIWGALIHRLL